MKRTIAELPATLSAAIKAVSSKRNCYLYTYVGGSTIMTGWDDGSRDEYVWVGAGGWAAKDGIIRGVDVGEVDPNRMGDPLKQRRRLPAELPRDCVALLQFGVSRGKPSTPTLYLAKDGPYAHLLGAHRFP